MSAFMVVLMDVADDGWMDRYFAEVPALLAEHGAKPVAGGRAIHRLEGSTPVPDRMAILSFPSVDAAERFMADERYLPHRKARESGSSVTIFLLDNAARSGELA